MKQNLILSLKILSIPIMIFLWLCLITSTFTIPSCSQAYTNASIEFARAIDGPPQQDYGERIRVIDGCEYIEVDSDHFNRKGYSLTHKGNCKNH